MGKRQERLLEGAGLNRSGASLDPREFTLISLVYSPPGPISAGGGLNHPMKECNRYFRDNQIGGD